ncbi:hypothetical protein SAMN05421823_103283 [Catalinimonas alkaloidigena]|uniref:Uncharacterized protein n=1 Tax=Catalinimonas alkaloidigena TaxID=1075417 RepID=A0A1G9DXF8_9BACT|nr:hypothetical protein [Catalinimonas alkaloidigena]SDK68572.1 hypothetical protein SAMN05421823_103283 [Catalinimonas alkaloidigena]
MKFFPYAKAILGCLFLLWVGMMGSGSVQAQAFSTDPTEFSEEFGRYLLASAKPSSEEARSRFLEVWPTLSAANQQRIIAVAQQMRTRRLGVTPYFEAWVGSMAQAATSQQVQGDGVGGMLDVSERLLQEKDAKEFLRYFSVARGLLDSLTLHAANYSQLTVEGGSFSFEYVAPEEASEGAALDETEEEELDDDQPTLQEDDSELSDDWFSDWDGNDPQEMPTDLMPTLSDADVSISDAPLIEVPVARGAVITFHKANLTISSHYDTLTIRETSGQYSSSLDDFIGEGGTVDWSSAGLPDVYAEFSKYSFDRKAVTLQADKAQLHYPERVDEPIEGVFEFRSQKHKTPEDAQYPRFRSFSNEVKVKNLGEGITYQGGFSLRGAHANSSSFDRRPSSLEIERNGQRRFRTLASRMELGDTLITADLAYVALYFGQDSIVNRGASLFYNIEEGFIRLHRDKGLYKVALFEDSYHQVKIDCDAIYWPLDSTSVKFYMLNARHELPATFTSFDFYKQQEFDRLQRSYNFHPIVMIASHVLRTKQTSFYVDDLAKQYKQNPQTLRTVMSDLDARGYVEFNSVTGVVTANKSLINYYLAHRKKRDYDYLTISSLAPDGNNAVLDLESQELAVNGVKKFYLSDSVDVFIEPANGQVKVLENRDLLFDGKLKVGYFESSGRNMRFDYDEFAVDMAEVDTIAVALGGEGGNESRSTLTNRSNNAAAKLIIGDPNNKSNLKSHPKYPLFDVTSETNIYFDGDEVLGGAYDQSIYFQVPPFSADSLDSDSPDVISFDGTFDSDGIFPRFEETLVRQKDKSLGFSHATPDGGYPLYGTEGRFFGDITLDSRGLRGKGEVRYLTSTIKSDDFVFYQDSVVTVGQQAVIARNSSGTYPDITVSNYKMKWLPDTDSLILSNVERKEPFKLYDGNSDFNGDVILTSKGTYGNGLFKTQGSQLYSPQITFEENRIYGRNGDFDIKSDNPLKPALVSRNVRYDVNLKERYAELSSEVEGFASNEFPFVQYKTSIGKAIWDMEKQTVSMQKPEGVDLESSYFYSTHPDQDSLAFLGTGAVYDVVNQKLEVSGVPYIKAADAKIFPHGGVVTLTEGAAMQELERAELVVDTLNEYHRLSDGTIQILSRHKFEGEAFYDYITASQDTFKIKFDNFLLEEEEARRKGKPGVLHTVSGGIVPEEDPMPISKGVLYRGAVTMYATRPYLKFDGEVKLDFKSSNLEGIWFTYQNPGDSPDFSIDLEQLVSTDGKPLTTGMHVEKNSSGLYFTFLSEKMTAADQDIFRAIGVLNYDPEKQLFVVGNPEKVRGESIAGNIFAFNDSKGTFNYEGTFNFTNPGGRDVTLLAAGSGFGRADSNSYDFNTMLLFDAPLPSQAYGSMGNDLAEAIYRLGPPVAYESLDPILPRVANLVSEKAAVDYRTKALENNEPLSSLSGKLAKGIVIADVHLKWSNEQSAWYSVGKIGVANINGAPIDAKLDGHIEIRKTYQGDIITIYIAASPGLWYYFRYDDEKRLSVVSSSLEFNEIIRSKVKGAGKPGEFSLQAANDADRVIFVEDFNKTYFGKEVNVMRGVDPEVAETPTTDAAGKDGGKKDKKKGDKKPDAPVTDPTPAPAKTDKKTVDEEDADGF